MDTILTDDISNFASPSDNQLITLTIGQLRELVNQAIQPLQDRIDTLEDRITHLETDNAAMSLKMASMETLEEQDINRITRDIAYDRQRITKLEHPIKEPGKTELSRAEKIQRYLTTRPDHKATFETLRGYLGIDKFALNDAVRTLMDASPDQYRIIRSPGDKRKRILLMR